MPVPARIGDPSTIKHVFLIVKENRTYDQVFGDVAQGNGDPTLAQFGEKVTPNQHALAKQFGLYDNTYDVGTNSAEGHNWLMQADNPEYTESSAGEYQRSYDTEDDVLGHQRTGFLWTGRGCRQDRRNYGEYIIPTKPAGALAERTAPQVVAATGQDTAYPKDSASAIPSLNAFTTRLPAVRPYVPDLYRAEIWKRDFEKRPREPEHDLAPQRPHRRPATAAARRRQRPRGGQDRRRDLAQPVLEGLGDLRRRGRHPGRHRPRRRAPRPGPDHQPVGDHGVVDSHYYTQITMVRTIEQILGVQPMNQKDAAASPMSARSTRRPT